MNITRLLAPGFLAFSCSPLAHAILVDPSESPTGCALPAGSALAGCHVSYICDATVTKTGPEIPGTISRVEVNSNECNNCNESTKATCTVGGQLSASFDVTYSVQGTWEIPEAFKTTISVAIKAGLVATFSDTRTQDVDPHTWIILYGYLDHDVGRTQPCSADYRCKAFANYKNYLDPLVDPRCRDGQIPPQSYSGGLRSFSAVLSDGVVPHFYSEVSHETCPEIPK